MQDNIHNIPVTNRPLGGGDFYWADETKAAATQMRSCNTVKEPVLVGIHAVPVGSNHSSGTILFLQKDHGGIHEIHDDETTTTDESNSAFCLSENPTNYCSIDDDNSGGSKTNVTESRSSCSRSTEQLVNLYLDHTSELLDREKIHRNASKPGVDLLAVTTLHISRKTDLSNQDVPPEGLLEQLPHTGIVYEGISDRGAVSCLLSSSEVAKGLQLDIPCQESQQTERRQEEYDLMNLTDKQNSVVSSSAIFADISDFSSSESPLDSFEPSDLTASRSLPNACEDEFQRIIDGVLFQYPLNKIQCILSVELNNAIKRSSVPTDPEEEILSRELNSAHSPLRRVRVLLKLGSLHMKSGRLDAAVGAFGLSVKEVQALRKKDVALALAANSLGIAFKTKGYWGKAICCFRNAFSVRRRELGKNHVDTIDSLNHLGSSLLHSGDTRGAQKCFREVFWARKAIFGSSHPGVAVASHDLANVLLALGNYNEAKKFYMTSWVIYHRIALHKSHPSMVRLVQDIENLKEMKRGARAEV